MQEIEHYGKAKYITSMDQLTVVEVEGIVACKLRVLHYYVGLQELEVTAEVMDEIAKYGGYYESRYDKSQACILSVPVQEQG